MPRKKNHGDDAKKPRRRLDPIEIRQILASLSPEDVKLLSYLWLLRYLRTAQIHELCYTGRSVQWVRQRLDALRLRRVVNRVKKQSGRSSWAFWYLNQVGLQGAQEQVGIPEHKQVGIRQYTGSAMYSEHHADAADVYIELSRYLTEFNWMAMHHRYGYQFRDQFGNRVDGYLMADGSVQIPAGFTSGEQLITTGKWWTFFLELDTGKMDHPQMVEKFRRYSHFYGHTYESRGWTGEEQNLFHWLVVVCRSAERAINIQALIDASRLPGWAVTLDQVSLAVGAALPQWWYQQAEARKLERERLEAERHRRDQQLTASLREAGKQWREYLAALREWEQARDTWARTRHERQLFSRLDIEFYRYRYAYEVKAPPARPVSERPADTWINEPWR